VQKCEKATPVGEWPLGTKGNAGYFSAQKRMRPMPRSPSRPLSSGVGVQRRQRGLAALALLLPVAGKVNSRG